MAWRPTQEESPSPYQVSLFYKNRDVNWHQFTKEPKEVEQPYVKFIYKCKVCENRYDNSIRLGYLDGFLAENKQVKWYQMVCMDCKKK